MHRIGDDVTQLEQVERTLVRDSCRLLTNGKPSSQDVFSERRGIFAIAVKAPADANEPASLHVVGEQRPTVPGNPRLLRISLYQLPSAALVNRDTNSSGNNPSGSLTRIRTSNLSVNSQASSYPYLRPNGTPVLGNHMVLGSSSHLILRSLF